MTLNEIAAAAYANVVSKGFYDVPPTIERRLCLIHSEVSEALEAVREGNTIGAIEDIRAILDIQDDEAFKRQFEMFHKNTFWDEIADVIIRCLDLAGADGVDIEGAVLAKMRYNSLRPKMHGGKKF